MPAKLSGAQFGVLDTLVNFGPVSGVEVLMPAAMDGSRRVKLECHVLNSATLAKLEGAALVAVVRGAVTRPVDATGRPGRKRRSVLIGITDAGRAALAAA